MVSQPPSFTYQRQSQWLFERCQRQEISQEEYKEQLRQAAEQEIQTHVQRETAQLRMAIQQYEADQQAAQQRRQKEQEEKRRLAEEAERKRLADERRAEQERLQQEEARKKEEERKERERTMQPLLEYRDTEIPSALDEMRKRARRNRGWSNTLQIFIIVVSSVATAIVNIESIPRFVTAVLTVLIAITTGAVWVFRFKEKSVNSQQTADAIEYERNLYRLGIKDYAGKSPQEAHVLFATRVEDLKNEQKKRQQLLEQTSDRNIAALQEPTTP